MNEIRLHDVAERRNGSEPTDPAEPTAPTEIESLLQAITRDMVDAVDAPPFDDVRRSIGRRARALRRRRQVRRVTAGGILAAAAALAVVTLHPVRPDVEVGPAGDGAGGTGTAAAITLELDGWTLERAEEHHDVADLTGAGAGAAADEASVQLFRVRDRLDGPVVLLEQRFATDTVGPSGGGRPVDVAGAPGYLVEEINGFSLRWNPGASDSEAQLTAFGLDEDEVLEFARALDRRDADGTGDDDSEVAADLAAGFAAATAPRGIEEVELAARRTDPVDVRRMWFAGQDGNGGRSLVEIQVDNRGERAFETALYDPANLAGWDAAEQVTVLGRSALLRHDAVGGRWVLQWQHDEDTWVTVAIGTDDDADGKVDTGPEDVDRATIDRIVGHLDELSERSWRDALAAAPAG